MIFVCYYFGNSCTVPKHRGFQYVSPVLKLVHLRALPAQSVKKRTLFSDRLMGPVWSAGNVIFSITHIISRLRKKPENKKCKILDERCFNVQSLQRHQIVIEYRLLDLKSMQNPLYFGTFSGRVGDICRFG